VPDLLGLTYVQARARLDSFGLSVGVVNRAPAVRDTAESYIVKQDPPQFGDDNQINHIHMGQLINIWLDIHKPGQGSDSSSTPGGY
jgi:hypothetical protein